MSYEVMQGHWQRIYGRLLELSGSLRADSNVWMKGRHIRINGMLQVSQSRARLALARAAARH